VRRIAAEYQWDEQQTSEMLEDENGDSFRSTATSLPGENGKSPPTKSRHDENW
jgi:hypothetical protein